MTATVAISELRAAMGDGCVLTGDAIPNSHLGDWGISVAAAAGPIAVAYPRDTGDVAAALRICHAHKIPVVPQGGMTGLAGGATPVPGAIALSLHRMRTIEELDPAAATITVQAGVPLQGVQDAAEAAGLLFPLDIGSRGSCLIGGNVSTNAGGTRVLRYGMARELVLGIEVVLADGTVLTSLNKMLKNNAGYDLKHLFIGSEGTLGMVTRVVLRLFPRPAGVCTAFCALPNFAALLDLLRRARQTLAGTLSAFELIWPDFYHLAITAHGCRAPLPEGAGCYVLIDAMGAGAANDAETFGAMIEAALEAGVVTDAVLAQSMRESRELWSVRDSVVEFQRSFSPRVDFDVSLPIARMQDFIDDCTSHLAARDARTRTVWFGHVADSNLHLCVQRQPGGPDKSEIDAIVYGRVREFGGSISAEHGIGLLKKAYLSYSRTPEEIEVMRRIKAALDPAGILNPGKIF